MWVSKKKWNELQKRVADLEKREERLRENMKQEMFDLAKKILRQPDELSKEIEDMENIEKFIDDFIQS